MKFMLSMGFVTNKNQELRVKNQDRKPLAFVSGFFMKIFLLISLMILCKTYGCI
jgi:hypothetical protein